MRRLTTAVFFVILICQLCGCVEPQFAYLYIDNDSKQPLQLEIDGVVQRKYVRRAGSTRYKIPFGEHQITVKSDGKVLVDSKKRFEATQNKKRHKNYLLNPSGKVNYALYRVTYSDPKQKNQSCSPDKFQRSLSRGQWIMVPDNAFVFKEPSGVLVKEGEATVSRDVVRRIKRKS